MLRARLHLRLLQLSLAVRKFCRRTNGSSSHRCTWAVCDSTARHDIMIYAFREATDNEKGNVRHTCWPWHEGQPCRSFPSQEGCCPLQPSSASWQHMSCCSTSGSSSHQSIWVSRGKPTRGNESTVPHASREWHTSQRLTAFAVACRAGAALNAGCGCEG